MFIPATGPANIKAGTARYGCIARVHKSWPSVRLEMIDIPKDNKLVLWEGITVVDTRKKWNRFQLSFGPFLMLLGSFTDPSQLDSCQKSCLLFNIISNDILWTLSGIALKRDSWKQCAFSYHRTILGQECPLILSLWVPSVHPRGLTILRCRFHCTGVLVDRPTLATPQLLDFDLFPELPGLS